ncbi:MAG: hypothetical protein JXO44_00515 [Clostridia bacterium]|nr:hypothetical protein [Clostridia bacterium]
MIKIVTGQKNAGKTTYLKHKIKELEPCDGFLSMKAFDEDNFLGYELYHLGSGERQRFIVNDDNLCESSGDKRLGDFLFLGEGIAFGKTVLRRALKASVNVVIDEIAQMELMNDVFYEEVKVAIQLQQSSVVKDAKDDEAWDLYLVVRKALIGEVVEKFDIQAYQLIQIEGGEAINET